MLNLRRRRRDSCTPSLLLYFSNLTPPPPTTMSPHHPPPPSTTSRGPRLTRRSQRRAAPAFSPSCRPTCSAQQTPRHSHLQAPRSKRAPPRHGQLQAGFSPGFSPTLSQLCAGIIRPTLPPRSKQPPPRHNSPRRMGIIRTTPRAPRYKARQGQLRMRLTLRMGIRPTHGAPRSTQQPPRRSQLEASIRSTLRAPLRSKRAQPTLSKLQAADSPTLRAPRYQRARHKYSPGIPSGVLARERRRAGAHASPTRCTCSSIPTRSAPWVLRRARAHDHGVALARLSACWRVSRRRGTRLPLRY